MLVQIFKFFDRGIGSSSRRSRFYLDDSASAASAACLRHVGWGAAQPHLQAREGSKVGLRPIYENPCVNMSTGEQVFLVSTASGRGGRPRAAGGWLIHLFGIVARQRHHDTEIQSSATIQPNAGRPTSVAHRGASGVAAKIHAPEHAASRSPFSFRGDSGSPFRRRRRLGPQPIGRRPAGDEA